MRSVFIFIVGLGLPTAFAHAGSVTCTDSEHSVELSAKLGKNNAGASDIKVKSGDKVRAVNKNDVTRMRTNATDFYMLFTVKTKNGAEELELDTHYSKGGAKKSSAGFLTNKTEKSERLPVSCKFI